MNKNRWVKAKNRTARTIWCICKRDHTESHIIISPNPWEFSYLKCEMQLSLITILIRCCRKQHQLQHNKLNETENDNSKAVKKKVLYNVVKSNYICLWHTVEWKSQVSKKTKTQVKYKYSNNVLLYSIQVNVLVTVLVIWMTAHPQLTVHLAECYWDCLWAIPPNGCHMLVVTLPNQT